MPADDSPLRCPQCSAVDTRPSTRTSMVDRYHSALGEEPWRCRTCRHRFYGKIGASGTAATGKKRKRKREEKRPGARLSTRSRKRLIHAALFVTIVVIFYVFLRFITREPLSRTSEALRVHIMFG